MRATTSKYGALNAWEVAYFKDKFAHHDLDGDGFLTLGEVIVSAYLVAWRPACFTAERRPPFLPSTIA